MATVAVQRVPFGELAASRIQKLSSVKNYQDALPTAFAPERKSMPSTPSKSSMHTATKRRRDPDPLDDFDAENIDPSMVASPMKKAKNSNFSATPEEPRVILVDPLPGVKRRTSSPSPRLAISAARTPPRKNRTQRRVSGISPPTPVLGPELVGLPFGTDTALAGTIGRTPKKAVTTFDVLDHEAALPKSWFFNIHVDTPEEEMTNLMEHGACVLEISDDEAKKAERNARGKENVPPADHPLYTTTNVGANPTALRVQYIEDTVAAIEPRRYIEAMTDGGDRVPLGDLEAWDFYAEGLTKSSVEVVIDAPEITDNLSNNMSSISPVDEVFKKPAMPTFAAPSRPHDDAKKDEKKNKLPKMAAGRHRRTSAPSRLSYMSKLEKDDDEFTIWQSGSGDEADHEDENKENVAL